MALFNVEIASECPEPVVMFALNVCKPDHIGVDEAIMICPAGKSIQTFFVPAEKLTADPLLELARTDVRAIVTLAVYVPSPTSHSFADGFSIA
jgi:hypothetical protein